MKVSKKQFKTLSKDHLLSLYELMKVNGDEINSTKIIDLYEKLVSDQLIISFSGHFSAGKSSIINYILGQEVLPNSPIPTSANIVKLTSGEGVARIFFNEEAPVEYAEPYDIDMIKDYCMDKDTISRIEISTSEDILPKNSALLDTPGIDAADDADRLMTESSLHLVDTLFYVMDYNHVQSEVNLYFLKEIQAQGIPIYIIINQIDKHNEAEIGFTTFNDSVKQTFDQWKIKVEGVYYTSALNEQANHNQIKQLKSDLSNLMESGRQTPSRIKLATQQIIEAHQEVLKAELEDSLIAYAQNNIEDFDISRYTDIQEQMKHLDKLSIKLHEEYYSEIDFTLKNAYLMPAKLRDAAGAFLETQQKDFKVGLFNAKNKTAEARQLKLTEFLVPLQQTIDSTIQWKLREKFVQLLNEYEIMNEDLLKRAQNFSIQYGESELKDLMKQGATINGNYILNYTNDVSADIKSNYRKAASKLWSEISIVHEQQLAQQREKLEIELNEFDKVDLFISAEADMQVTLEDKLNSLDSRIDQPVFDEGIPEKIINVINMRKNVMRQEIPIVKETITKQPITEIKQVNEEIQDPKVTTTTSDIIKIINSTTETLNDMPAFQSLVTDLTDKQTRLKNRELTIALFGAFSAGKSSFSNALFGEQVLPVSPNPTTAVISRISPVSETHKHGTVIITCKDDVTLTEDLQMITKDLSPEAVNFNEMIDWIKRAHVHYNQTLSNMYQSYLNAVLKGYEDHKDLLGKTIEISLDEFTAYVTDESKACYIETVDLYYDCALTRKGITIVDTPGADSVNARHTNVSFDYIKEADAILYVTYYNHAITSADRDFLVQLGRVKEAFELDKMYFIVNASDLAQSDADLNLVLTYVEEQLLQFGIRHPKIFPVSSKLSLEEKVNNQALNTQMHNFESQFYKFIEEDLAALTIESAMWDINRAQSILKNFINTARLDKTEQNKHIEDLQVRQKNINQLVANLNTDVAAKRMKERIARQLHFVLERLYIRFHDMFTQFFNPTTITGSGKKAQLELSLNRNHFVDYTGYELLQEVRAVSLRMEAYIKELLKELYVQLQHEIKEIDSTFIIPSLHECVLTTPGYEQAFTSIDMSAFNDVLKIFKNTKTFFEQNEREKMKDSFYEVLKPFSEKYLKENKIIMEDNYIKQWENEIKTMKKYVTTEVNYIIENNIKMITDTVDVSTLKLKYEVINNILEQVNEG